MKRIGVILVMVLALTGCASHGWSVHHVQVGNRDVTCVSVSQKFGIAMSCNWGHGR